MPHTRVVIRMGEVIEFKPTKIGEEIMEKDEYGMMYSPDHDGTIRMQLREFARIFGAHLSKRPDEIIKGGSIIIDCGGEYSW
jgi:hypothetical protein